jgi:hypothetical protein
MHGMQDINFSPAARHPSHFVAKKLDFANFDDDRHGIHCQNIKILKRQNHKVAFALHGKHLQVLPAPI